MIVGVINIVHVLIAELRRQRKRERLSKAIWSGNGSYFLRCRQLVVQFIMTGRQEHFRGYHVHKRRMGGQCWRTTIPRWEL